MARSRLAVEKHCPPVYIFITNQLYFVGHIKKRPAALDGYENTFFSLTAFTLTTNVLLIISSGSR